MGVELDGSITQSVHVKNMEDYPHEGDMNIAILGVVVNLHPSDARTNRSAVQHSEQRGSAFEADVISLNDGSDTPWIIPNCVVLPRGSTGVDNYSEELPRPATQMIDGSEWNGSLADIDPDKLDGDRVIVQFIGGIITQPIITHWFPHPGNISDPATGGYAGGETGTANEVSSNPTLIQGPRCVKRFAGTRLVITGKGSIYIDTNEANSTVEGSPSGIQRKKTDDGGDIQVDMKPERQLEVNFNPPLDRPETEPSLFQPNPPLTAEDLTAREVDLTRFLLSKDFVRAVAGQIVEMKAFQDMFLGDEGATENLVLGQAWKSMMSAVLGALASHVHPTGVGPSGPPSAPELTTFNTEKTNVDNEDHLSDWVFTQKAVPVP